MTERKPWFWQPAENESGPKKNWDSIWGRVKPLLFPLIVLVASSIYQSIQTLDKIQLIPVEKTVGFHSQNDGELFIHFVYPPKIKMSEDGTVKAHLSVWLSYATPFPSTTPTPAKSATLKTQQPSTTTWITSATDIANTPTPTAMPYILSMNVTPNGLTFTDENGRPVSAQIVLTPSRFGVTPAALYLQENSLSGDGSLNIVPFIQNAVGSTALQTISIEPETRSAAGQRLFWSLVLTPALIGALLVALASAAIQQWGKADDERRNKAKAIDDQNKERKEQIENLSSLIKDKPADGARKYLEIRKTIGASQFLDTIWSSAPDELKSLVELDRAFKNSDGAEIIKTLGPEKVERALKFAIRHGLDEDWESRAAVILQEIIRLNLLPLDGQLLQWAEQRSREALLKVWPGISYWRLSPPPDRKATIQEKWAFYEETPYPFGAPRAEENIWLFGGSFHRYSDQKALVGIERKDSLIVIGSPGWGKTSTALWLMDYAMRTKNAFPIYIPAEIGITLAELASPLANTLLHYLSINPSAYLRRGITGRASIAHLFAEYLGTGSKLTLLLREAGLPRTGDGMEMEQDILKLIQDYPVQSNRAEQEILNLLSESYPDGFTKTWILLDVQDEINKGTRIDHLFELIRQLNRIGLKTKVFLSSKINHLANLRASPIPVTGIEWGADNLKGLINTRLQELGEESLRTLCKPGLRQADITPEERLAAASHGKPGLLAQKGNELLKRISRNKDLLSEDDLNEIL